MKVALISSRQAAINFLPELQEALEKKILDIEVEQFEVQLNTDIPRKTKGLLGFDMIFVSIPFKEETQKIRILIQKLVDLDLAAESKIINGVEEIQLEEDLSAEEAKEIKKSEAEKWSNIILEKILEAK